MILLEFGVRDIQQAGEHNPAMSETKAAGNWDRYLF